MTLISLMRSNNVGTSNGGTNDWHLNIAHGNNAVELASTNRNVAEIVFLKIMQGLDTTESGPTTYLDNTLMWMSGECGYGHSGIGMNGFMAGNTAGGMGLGKIYDFGDYARAQDGTTEGLGQVAPGQPINRLWVGVLKSLGLEPADYLNKYGNGNTTFGYSRSTYPTAYEAPFGDLRRDARVSQSLAGLFTK